MNSPAGEMRSQSGLAALLGALLLTLAMIIRWGPIPPLFNLVALCLFAAAALRSRRESPMPMAARAFAPMAIAVLAMQLGWLVSAIPLLGPHGSPRLLVDCDYGWAACGACAIAAIADAPRAKAWLFATLALSAVMGLAIVRLNPSPPLDVHLFHLQAFEALRSGRSPYGASITNLYPGAGFYGAEVLSPDQSRVLIGYPYPPLQLMLAFAAQLFFGLFGGDYRWLHAVALPLSGALLFFARPGRNATAAAALLALLPCGYFLLAGSWTEPVLLLLFSLSLFTSLRAPRLFPFALGLFFADKQYAVLLAPLVFFLVPAPRSAKQVLRVLLIASGTALAVTLPLALWNLRGFIDDVILFQIRQPFRSDSLSVSAGLIQLLGGLYGETPWQLTPQLTQTLGARFAPGWSSFAGLALGLGLSLWRAPRTAQGFAAAAALTLGLFFGFAKQSFENYLMFVAGCALWAVALAGSAEPNATASATNPQVETQGT